MKNENMLKILNKLNPKLQFRDKSEIGEQQLKTVEQLIEEFKNNNIDDTKFYELKVTKLNRVNKLIIINNRVGVGSPILFMENGYGG